MNRISRLFLGLITSALLLASCTRDRCRSTFKIKVPVYRKLSDVRADMHSAAARPIQSPGKFIIQGNWIFLNEFGKGIHLIDNSNPASPRPHAFLPLPGNVDLAVQGAYLYADSWTDLVVLDLSNMNDIRPVRIIDDAFPDQSQAFNGPRTTPDQTFVVADFAEKDTTGACDDLGRLGANELLGDLNAARFALIQQHLYTHSASRLRTFSLANPAQPQLQSDQNAGNPIERIEAFGSGLLVRTPAGLQVYNLNNAAQPSYSGAFPLATPCDQVVADGSFAWVVVRGGSGCGSTTSKVDVVNIANLSSPQLVRSYTLNNPFYLAADSAHLFTCDAQDGIRYYDATNPANLMLRQHVPGVYAFGAIARGGYLLVASLDGLYQYRYGATNQLEYLSRIAIQF